MHLTGTFSRTGSSPLARGLPSHHDRRASSERIIPARAGFTRGAFWPRPRSRDHPRSRGVYCCKSRPGPIRVRIIPARAGFTPPAGTRPSRTPDHPRSRGVYSPARATVPTGSGSSPLARGLPAHVRGRAGPARIIPARAGFTRCRPATRRPRPDHPRSRGVYSGRSSGCTGNTGSSPLARGLPAWCGPCCLISRIIPARAGFTDIPCTRTEIGMGSSPLARGLLRRCVRRGRPRRIIPARAGFTCANSASVPTVSDHPRSRGVYLRRLRHTGRAGGSSPLARGLLGADFDEAMSHGIIPARAGFTRGRPPPTRSHPDHPRSRGVYHVQVQLHHPVRGIIPARAGFTRRAAAVPRRERDHPRSRGVYSTIIPGGLPPKGSSPLARGLHLSAPDAPESERIIPARAGFTDTPRPAPPSPTDHPRSRGVYVGAILGYLDQRRIIPARAGFTSPRWWWETGRTDHPRSRGVYWSPTVIVAFLAGSSPLARGLPDGSLRQGWGQRIIPARAGFTAAQQNGQNLDMDHPRSRGVYVTVGHASTVPAGSSPLARGLRPADRPGKGFRRIIPARAGFTPPPARRKSYRTGSSPLARGLPGILKGHPHHGRIIPARAGFTWGRSFLQGMHHGSSPLARGLRGHDRIVLPESGIIPARAGFTASPTGTASVRRDHPRSRGVYSDRRPTSVSCSGSSPLARGLPGRPASHPVNVRIIPARAGFTLPH